MKCLKTNTHALLVNISVTSNSEKQHLTKTKLISLILVFLSIKKPQPDDKKGMSGYQESSSLHQYQLKLHDRFLIPN